MNSFFDVLYTSVDDKMVCFANDGEAKKSKIRLQHIQHILISIALSLSGTVFEIEEVDHTTDTYWDTVFRFFFFPPLPHIVS